MTKILCHILLLLTFGMNAYGQKSQFYKAAIAKDGVYTLDQKFFKDLGLKIKDIDPRYIRVFATGNKELLQELSQTASVGISWKEIPTQNSDTDGQFDKDDQILFYAEGPDEIMLIGDQNAFDLAYKKHSYANEAYVLIEVNSSSKGLSISSAAPVDKNIVTSQLKAIAHHELNDINILKTGREWYGEYLNSSLKINIPTPNIDEQKAAKLTARVIGKTYENTNLQIEANGEAAGTMPLKAINYRRNDAYRRYLRAGEISQEAFTINAKAGNQEISMSLPKDIDLSSGAYLDYLSISYLTNQEKFESQYQGYTFDQTPSFKNISNSSKYQIWDVTDPLTYTKGVIQNDAISFSKIGEPGSFSKFAFFDLDHTYTPLRAEPITLPQIKDQMAADMLIIYPSFFKKEAELLANHRSTFDGLLVNTVSLEEVYLLYSGGMVDPTAIRNYAFQYMPNLKYLLLFGDADYDLHNPYNLTYIDPTKTIPTYQSRESLEPIYSYCSDDYFAYLTPGEGTLPEGYRIGNNWISPAATDAKMDIGVGRLPVKNKTEARLLVEKLINRDYQLANTDADLKKIFFVADDGDNNIHVQDTEDFSGTVADSLAFYLPEKILMDAYPQLKTDLGETSPEAVKALEDAIADGAYIINYNGHGSPNGWTDEKLLTLGQISQWHNGESLPIFFTATCEFGRYDDPAEVSGAELALLNPYGGVAALLTTTRPVFSSTNYLINDAFYSIALKSANEHSRLGDVFKQTKNNAESGQINRNFTLLGDPSMHMDLPSKAIEIVAINGEEVSDAILKSQQKNTFNGHLENDNFNGKINVQIYGKPYAKRTLGNTGNSPTFYTDYTNILYAATYSVTNGGFEGSFILPQTEKVTIYYQAISADGLFKYAGKIQDMNVLAADSSAIAQDTKAPEVRFEHDEDTGMINIYLNDSSGINTSVESFFKGIFIKIDDDTLVNVSHIYKVQENYTEGTINWQIPPLTDGNHTIVLKVADNYNNPIEVAFSFTLANDKKLLKILDLMLYPNPVEDFMHVKMQQNKEGADLDLQMSVFNANGQQLYQNSILCQNCKKEEKFGLNLEDILTDTGVYFCQITIKDKLSNQSDTVSKRLIFWK